MSLVLDLLKDLSEITLNYKGVNVNFFSMPVSRKYGKNSLRGTIYALSKNNMIKNIGYGSWIITDKGEKYLKDKIMFVNLKSPFRKNANKDLLLMFDVPEEMRRERNWLRDNLKIFGYTMLQKSVWVGPSPLPKEFITQLKELGLTNHVKKFKLAKPYAQ